MATNKAKFKINTSLANDRGYEAISAQVLTIQLEDATDVQMVTYELYDATSSSSPLASLNAPDLTFIGGVHSKTLGGAGGGDPASSTSITMITNGAETHSWLLRATAVTDTGSHVYERIIALKNGKPRKTIPSEDTEYSLRGWSDAWNELVDYVTGVIGAGGYTTVQDEGVSRPQRNTINFTGAGVSVADVGSVTTVTINGSSAPTGSATGQVQKWDGAAWISGAVDLADADAVTGKLPFANLDDLDATSVLGRSAGTSGVPAAIAASADNQVLQRTGGVLAFAALAFSALTGAITLAQLPTASAASVLGRSAATTGVYADIASSADGQVLRRAAGVVSWGAVDLADSDAVTGLLPFANIANGSALSVFGRSANSSGVQASIAASSDGQVLRRSGTTLGFGTIATAGIGDDQVTFAKLANGSALSVLGVAGNAAADHASIVAGAADLVLRAAGDGLSIGFGQVATGGITNNAVTLAKLAQGTAASLLGRSPATVGNYADIVSSTDGQVLVRAGGVLAFGALDLADPDAVTGLLPFANVASLAGLSVLGRAGNTTGVMAAITGTDGQVLRVSGTTLAFGTLPASGIADGSLPVAKLADATASSVLGRSAATTGPYADIVSSADGQVLVRGASGVIAWGAVDLADADAVTGLLPFANITSGAALSVLGRSANSSGVHASIAGTAHQVLRVSAGSVLGFGSIDLSQSTTVGSSQLPYANIASATAASVLGRSGASGGVLADIASTVDGQVLRRSGGVLGWGAVDLADVDAVTGTLPIANIASIAGLSVLGRSASTTGAVAAITGTTDQVLRVDGAGTTLGFGTINTAGITNSAVTLAKLANGTAASLVGRAGATTGVYADITSSADGQVLRRSGGVLAFGALDLADADGVTGVLAFANMPNLNATSVLGRAGGTSGAMAGIAGSTDQVLRVDGAGTTLAFGTVATGGITNNAVTHAKYQTMGAASVLGRAASSTGNVGEIAASADGQVLRRIAGGIGWGALDLADADAVTGLLPSANIAPAAADGRVLITTAGAPAWGFALGNNTDAFSYNAVSHTFQAAGTSRLTITTTAINLGHAALQFLATVTSPSIGVNSDGTAGITGQPLTVYGQDVTGTTAPIGGLVRVRGGNSTNGVGGVLDLRSGAGASATQAGDLTVRVGSTIFLSAAGTVAYPTSGFLRIPNNQFVNFASSVGSSINGIGFDAGNRLKLGSTSADVVGMDYNVGSGTYVWAVGGTTELALSSSTLNAQNNVVLTTGEGRFGTSGSGALRIPNNSELYSFLVDGVTAVGLAYVNAAGGIIYGDIDAASISMVAAGGSKLVLGTSAAEFGGGVAQIRFDNSITGGVSLIHEADATTAQATANKFSIGAQSRTGTGATVGAELELASGTGLTPGVFTMKRGSQVIYQTTTNGGINYNTASGQLHTFQSNAADLFYLSSGRLSVAATSLAIEVGGFGGAPCGIYIEKATTTSSNIAFNPSSFSAGFGSGQGMLYVGKATTAPTGSPTNGVWAWVADNAADGKFGLITRSDDGIMRLGNGAVTDLELRSAISTSNGVALRTSGVYFVHTSGAAKTAGNGAFTTTYGVTLGYATTSVAQLAYDTVALGTISTGNVSLFASPGGFSGMQGGIYLADANAVPTAAPGSGGFLYSASGLNWYSPSTSTAGAWTFAPSGPWGRRVYYPSCGSFASTAQQTIATQSFLGLPSNCAGYFMVKLTRKTSAGHKGVSYGQGQFKKVSGTLTLPAAVAYMFTAPGDVGDLNITAVGSDLVVKNTTSDSTSSTFSCQIEVELISI